MNLTLIRDLDDGRCTLGTMRIGDAVFQTLERPWIPGPPGGAKGISCVPPGQYQLERHDTEAHPRAYALVNPSLGVYHFDVPAGQQGRTACLIHVANRPEELRGCIALGMTRVATPTGWQIQQSRMAMNYFEGTMRWTEGHTIEIRGVT